MLYARAPDKNVLKAAVSLLMESTIMVITSLATFYRHLLRLFFSEPSSIRFCQELDPILLQKSVDKTKIFRNFIGRGS